MPNKNLINLLVIFSVDNNCSNLLVHEDEDGGQESKDGGQEDVHPPGVGEHVVGEDQGMCNQPGLPGVRGWPKLTGKERLEIYRPYNTSIKYR